ncbi:MAG: 5-dehydro-4-deoxyglucarate dehydratase [Acidobacteria bacterium]|nr:5-dehydro-4-deoxyglucarate dehydratase [Acidobacteriota bacterium]
MTSPDALRARLTEGGVIAFPITPFKPDLSLDLDGLRRNLELLMQHKLSAVVAAGGTGELYSLTPAEYAQVVKLTVEVVAGRAPVIAGAGFNQPLAVELAQTAAAAGADGILGFPPYYPQADEEGLRAYYQSIGAATKLGMLVYSRDWANFSPAQVEKMAASIPTLVAWKDGQGDLRRFQMIMNRVGERLYWIGGAGDDLVAGYYSLGIRTFTSSIATVEPRLSLQLHELAATGQQVELNTLLHQHVVPLYAMRTRRKGYEVSTMKTLMDLAGQSGGPVRPPLVDVKKEEVEELRTILQSWQQHLAV